MNVKKLLLGVFVSILIVALSLLGLLHARVRETRANENGHDEVTICHATRSDHNPYNQITVDEDAVDGEGRNDHNRDAHQDGEDIIPPGEWDEDGRNWDDRGIAIYRNGCNIPYRWVWGELTDEYGDCTGDCENHEGTRLHTQSRECVRVEDRK